jgi:phosphoglycolate phosphatase-like HAD superfamily hydrolase
MYRLFLFDIDGTLISSGGVGNKSLNRVFEEVYNVKDAMGIVKPCGKTDPFIVREVFKVCLGKDKVSQKTVDKVLNGYLKLLPKATLNSKNYKVLGGVIKFLKFLSKDKNNLLGLATGNLEKGARIKLERGDLNKYFSFGGFSSDIEERYKILAVAKKKAEKIVGAKISNSNVYIIGDTPLDIYACKKNNFKMIAVATGTSTYEALKKEKPDYLLKNLNEFKKLDIFKK